MSAAVSAYVQGREDGRGEYAALVARLQEQVEALTKERDRAVDERDEARQEPWPKWADEIRKCLEGYGVDPGDEWDLPEQFDDWIAGVVEGETARAEAAEAERDRLREALKRIALWEKHGGEKPRIYPVDIARTALQKEPQP